MAAKHYFFISSKLLSFFILLVCYFSPSFAAAQEDELNQAVAEILPNQIAPPGQTLTGEGETQPPNVITMLTVISIVALLPFAVILLTSFVKIVIVLSLLRNALGVQQAPPNQVLNGVALLMTVYVMFPTGLAMYNSAKTYIQEEAPAKLFSADAAGYIVNVISKTKEPLRGFLKRNMSVNHQRSFYQLAYKSVPAQYRKELKLDDFIIIIPAYITSQIKGAFEIGVLIYLPFFVIDLVTSNILLAMGMMMLSPLTIALPLKLLLIVMTDGWTLIIQGIVQTYRL